MEDNVKNTKKQLLDLQYEELSKEIQVFIQQNHQLNSEIHYQKSQIDSLKQTNQNIKDEIKKLIFEDNIHLMTQDEYCKQTGQQVQTIKKLKILKKTQNENFKQLRQEIQDLSSINNSVISFDSQNNYQNMKFKKLQNLNNSCVTNNLNQSSYLNQSISTYSVSNKNQSLPALYLTQIQKQSLDQRFKNLQQKLISHIKIVLQKNFKIGSKIKYLRSYNEKYTNKLNQMKDMFQNLYTLISQFYKKIEEQFKESVQNQKLVNDINQQFQQKQNNGIYKQFDLDLSFNQKLPGDETVLLDLQIIQDNKIQNLSIQQLFGLFSILNAQCQNYTFYNILDCDTIQSKILDDGKKIQIKILDSKPKSLLLNSKFKVLETKTSLLRKKYKGTQSTPSLLKFRENTSQYGIETNKKQQKINENIKFQLEDLQFKRFVKRLPKFNSNKSQSENQFIIYDSKNFSLQESISMIKNQSQIHELDNKSNILNLDQQYQLKTREDTLQNTMDDIYYFQSELEQVSDNLNQAFIYFREILVNWKEFLEGDLNVFQVNQNLIQYLDNILPQYLEEMKQLKQKSELKQQEQN